MVNVDFEWFNFDPEIDFHGTKSLLRQLFDVDANLFNMSALSDLILSQPTIGSTVKVDGKANDAYAMLTVLNTYEHRAPVLDVCFGANDNEAFTAGMNWTGNRYLLPPITSWRQLSYLLTTE